MDETTPAAEPQAGMSGANRKRTRGDRGRSRSNSSSSSCRSKSSSSSSSGSKRKRSRRHKKSKRTKNSNRMLDKLFQEIGELRKQVATATKSNNVEVAYQEHDDNVSITSQVSNELYDQNFPDEHFSEQGTQNLNFTFDIETKLKEPSVPKTSDKFLKMLVDMQRFNNPSWSEVRYAETQKLYNHSPGFIDLETNEEVKMYDTLRYLAHADKSYAAITYCILKQKESLQEGIRNLLFWAKHTEVNFDNLNDKLEELFLKGEFHKVSSDLLQLVCGHRAESIEMRRESITKQVRDPLVKATLNRIPPSQTHIFEADPFTSALEKAGGVRKAFWPLKTDAILQPRSRQTNSRPSRGHNMRCSTVPSRGTQCMYHESLPTHTSYNNPPSRGEFHHTKSYRGQTSSVPHEHNNANRGTFHNRGSRPDQRNYRGRAGATASRGNPRKSRQ